MIDLDNLTNDAKYLLSSLYKEYVLRRKNDQTKAQSVKFIDVEEIHKNYMSEWKIEDVEYTCAELKKNDFISGRYLSNKLQYITLTTYAISQLEETFSDKVNNILTFMEKIKNAIPFI
ncbi:hypothetical protein [Carnobacterium sp.]|uniref:hypothetical protein n=1 Tax=Carnobacterium sp. TaxID=48221 RepID=UPI00388F38F6